MKGGNAGKKINGQPKAAENVSSDQNVMGWRNLKSRRVNVEVHLGDKDCHLEKIGGDWLPAQFLDDGRIDRLEFERFDKAWTDGSGTRAGIDLCKRVRDRSIMSGSGDANCSCGSTLNQVLNSLLKTNLDPAGFVIICHSGASTKDALPSA